MGAWANIENRFCFFALNCNCCCGPAGDRNDDDLAHLYENVPQFYDRFFLNQ